MSDYLYYYSYHSKKKKLKRKRFVSRKLFLGFLVVTFLGFILFFPYDRSFIQKLFFKENQSQNSSSNNNPSPSNPSENPNIDWDNPVIKNLSNFELPENKEFHLPILMYHHLGESPDEESTSLYVTEESFSQQMDDLSENGYQAISLNNLYYALQNNLTLPEKTVVLTFDDGYLDNYEKAKPILDQYDFKATFFITVNLVGGSGYMNWDQTKEMAEDGFEIGSHGLDHLDLPSLSEKNISQQISSSKQILEEKTGQKIYFFSYPAGKYNDLVIQKLKENAYLGGVSTKRDSLQNTKAIFELNRFRIMTGYNVMALIEE